LLVSIISHRILLAADLFQVSTSLGGHRNWPRCTLLKPKECSGNCADYKVVC
jgi:hypothetical protein